MIFGFQKEHLALWEKNQVMSIFKFVWSTRVSNFEEFSIPCGFGDKIYAFFVVSEVYTKGNKVMAWTEWSAEELNSLMVPIDVGILHDVQNEFLFSSCFLPMDCSVLPMVFPVRLRKIFKIIKSFGDWCQSSVSPFGGYPIVLVSDVSPFAALSAVNILFLLHESCHRCWIIVEMALLIDPEMPVKASHLTGVECFMIVIHWKGSPKTANPSECFSCFQHI